MEHGFFVHRMDAFRELGALGQAHRVIRVVGVVDLPSDSGEASLDELTGEIRPLHQKLGAADLNGREMQRTRRKNR